MSDSTERRGASRFPASLPAVLRTPGAEHSCRAEQLSRAGVLLVGAIPPDAGPAVEVRVESAAADLRLEVAARVTRSERTEPGEIRLALRFERLGVEELATLESLISRVVEGLAPAALDGLPSNPTVEQIREALEQTPLAHRVTLAQRAQPRDRAILLHDTNSRVIDALTRNPQLLANEVRTMLRMPTLLPMTLEALARDARFSGNEELATLIAGHRNTPFAVAERLASRMSKSGVQRLVQLPGLNPALRTKLVRQFKL